MAPTYVLALIAASFGMVESSCYGTKYLEATKISKSVFVSYSSSSYCTYNVQPSLSMRNGDYFLQISWVYFQVKGNMPECDDGNYVKAILTRSNKDIGKFCSSNAGTPFTMYSHDGYAKIILNSASGSSGYFSINYVLKSKSYSSLGYSSSHSCPQLYLSSTSGVIYSNDWPDQYARSYTNCKHKITRSYSHNAMKIVFMDIDLNTIDCVAIKGSNYSIAFVSQRFDKLCSTSNQVSYITFDKYVQLEFERSSPISYKRGFVAGYITFSKPKSNSNTNNYNNRDYDSSTYSSIVWKISLPIIVICIAVVFLAKYRRRMRLHNNALANQQAIVTMQADQTAVISTTHTATTTAPSYPKPTNPYPAQPFYPTANNAYPISTSAYPTDGTSMAFGGPYPTAGHPYPPPGGSYPPQGFAAPPPYDIATTSVPSSDTRQTEPVGQGPTMTQGAFPSPQPANTQNVTQMSHGPPSYIPPVEQSGLFPDAPPPAYPTAPPPSYNTLQK